MTSDQSLILWNAYWSLVAGVVVCRGCQREQSLSQSNQPFGHGPGCNNLKDVGASPWADLHDILDAARG